MKWSCPASSRRKAVTLDAAELTRFLKERLASFKVPRAILFFREDELAVTGSGKVKFRILRDIAAERLAAQSSG